MTKKDVTLTVEENLLKKAKKQIPNLSAFFEECLKNYMGVLNGLYPTAEYKEMIDEISKIQAKLFILNQNYDYEKARKEVEDEKVNRALRKLWNEYRKNMIVDEQSMSEALEILPVCAETLEDMLDFAYVNQEELGLNFTWSKLYELYENEGVE